MLSLYILAQALHTAELKQHGGKACRRNGAGDDHQSCQNSDPLHKRKG